MKKKVFLVFGTRPEAIKMYPVYKELNKFDDIETKVIITSQHQEMLKQVLEMFEIKVDYDLNVMEDRQTLTKITVKVLNGMKEIFEKEKPNLTLVHGDTTTTFASALASFYEKIPIGHVEAGLRTYNKYSPFPEEMNRELTDALADLFFAPTEQTKLNLIKEGVKEFKIFVTGNTIVDSLLEIISKDAKTDLPIEENKKFIVVTAHRRENWGQPMENICKAIDYISKKYGNEYKIIFSVHKNPVVRNVVNNILQNNENVKLVEPMDYITFIKLLSKAEIILTDSGGIQEEAPTLKKPVLLLRETTERPEGIESGVVKLIGTNFEKIVIEVENLINNENERNSVANVRNPFGDGLAGRRIAKIVHEYLLSGGTDGIS
ncbi:MAG: UDP-N-acetylglucosamine 2-epimerase (non-hydrolyzing) [Caldisericaceae bacterium]